MTPEFVVGYARQAIEIALLISLPMLGIGLFCWGFLLALSKRLLQIQEMTLSFIPKIISIFCGPAHCFSLDYGQNGYVHHGNFFEYTHLHSLKFY